MAIEGNTTSHGGTSPGEQAGCRVKTCRKRAIATRPDDARQCRLTNFGYSVRSASSGATRIARRAGTYAAAIEAVARTAIAIDNTTGSNGLTS